MTLNVSAGTTDQYSMTQQIDKQNSGRQIVTKNEGSHEGDSNLALV